MSKEREIKELKGEIERPRERDFKLESNLPLQQQQPW